VKNILAKIIPLLFIGVILITCAFGCGRSTQINTSSQATSSIAAALNPVELTVCAGVGLTDALEEINDLYTQKNKNVKITPNFAAAGTLQKQIEQGAPADIFFTPGAKQMDALQNGGLILDGTRQDLLNNKVVLVVPANSNIGISDFTDLMDDEVQKIAIGDPEFVPAGTYGMQTLDLFGITEKIQTKLILCNDVRQVLNYVESGNVEAGLVYATDAAITDMVKVAATAPDEINRKIAFSIAVIKASKNVDIARDYIAFLSGDDAGIIFEKYGFSVVNK
jgi:molybdate transport system substrate-binding protein